MTAAEALLNTLQSWGVEYFFGCPGTTEAAILDAMVDREKPKFVLCTHEITAVSAADGYARITGRPGVALLHANVGLGNAVSSIHVARMARVPIVAINCIKSRAILGHGAFTTAHDHQETVKQYTKWDWQALRPQTLVEDLERAFRLALTPPMGPTYLAIPEDILAAEVDTSEIAEPSRGQLYSRPSDHDIGRASEILANARFPLIIAGASIAQEEAMEQVIKLAGMLSAPVCCENRLHMDYNTYPTEEVHFVGPFQPGADYVEYSDVILAIGCKLFVEFVSPDRPWIPPETKLIHLHPEASDIGNLYHAGVGLCGSVKAGIEDLLSALPPRLERAEQILLNRGQEVRAMHEEFISRRNDAFDAVQNSCPLKVASLARELAGLVDPHFTLVVDAATSNDVIVEYVPRYNTKSYFALATGGNLGWGMGAALGVKMGAPERKVFCIVGDGVFMFGMPALHVAAKNKVPVIFIVINNSSYAAVKSGLLRLKGRAAEKGIFPGTDIGGPDYATIAKGFGISAFKVVSEKDLRFLSTAAEKDDEPVLIEIVTDPLDVGRLAR
jgi:benzoylformate decarboxylase